MRYLVTSNKYEPFFTKWFEPLNHFNNDIGMVVYDLLEQKYTVDGKNWIEIQTDHL